MGTAIMNVLRVIKIVQVTKIMNMTDIHNMVSCISNKLIAVAIFSPALSPPLRQTRNSQEKQNCVRPSRDPSISVAPDLSKLAAVLRLLIFFIFRSLLALNIFS